MNPEAPLALDLCCGLGGWAKGLIAAGWRVVGVDIEDFSKVYPGEFVLADLLRWEMWRVMPVRLVVASTPCEEFSRWSMPWTRKRNPDFPSFALWNRVQYIAEALGVPIIQENVRGGQQFLGRSRGNSRPYHLWGDVPAVLPVSRSKTKCSRWSDQKAKRAEIDFHLAYFIGRYFLPTTGENPAAPWDVGGVVTNHP